MGAYDPGLGTVTADIAALTAAVGVLAVESTDQGIAIANLNTGMVDLNGGRETFTLPNPTNFLAAAAQAYYSPLLLAACTITQIGVTVATAGTAGSVVRLGLYDDNGTTPDVLLVDAGTIDGTLTGIQTILLGTPIVWPGGLIWGAVAAQGAPATEPTLLGGTSTYYPISRPNAFNATFDIVGESGVVGALPANANALSSITSGIGLRIRGL